MLTLLEFLGHFDCCANQNKYYSEYLKWKAVLKDNAKRTWDNGRCLDTTCQTASIRSKYINKTANSIPHTL